MADKMGKLSTKETITNLPISHNYLSYVSLGWQSTEDLLQLNLLLEKYQEYIRKSSRYSQSINKGLNDDFDDDLIWGDQMQEGQLEWRLLKLWNKEKNRDYPHIM